MYTHMSHYIDDRYAHLLRGAKRDRYVTSLLFYTLSSIITIAMALSTALLPLNQLLNGSFRDPLFWSIWSLMIILTIASRIQAAYSIDRRFIVSRVYYEKLRSEGWLFSEAVGIYEPLDDDARRRVFAARIEQMQLKTLENAALLDFSDTVEVIQSADALVGTNAGVDMSTDVSMYKHASTHTYAPYVYRSAKPYADQPIDSLSDPQPIIDI